MFSLLQIIYNVSLVFSSHVFLFALLFHANAFEASNLMLMKQLWKLFIENDQQELSLSLKQEMNDYYIFCKIEIMNEEIQIMWNTFMSTSAVDAQIQTSAEIHRFLQPMFLHCFHYGGRKMLDESSEWLSSFINVISSFVHNEKILTRDDI